MTDADYEPFFASDLAAEVRREYAGRIDHGVPVSDATRDVLAIFRDLLADPQEGPVIFLALAALQLRDGRVMAFIRDAALDLIGTGEAKRTYASSDATMNRQRRELLKSLEQGLESTDVIDEADRTDDAAM
ncbi:hypothetical protein [Humisphaera borealis]|uniref:Uncharacterized protein n=1 Tax=Humisphaera borealis TaxID=2807512 RepID=A0A7M2WYE1_9BACT|nr:hypothetical protein [Humisphaera borealis]QOV90423.1 hypothetical protein IPV69_03380 [Humisphaera borealis]